MITFIFSMDGPLLNEEQLAPFQEYVQWKVVNQRNDRLLVDGIGEKEDLLTVLQQLESLGRNPTPIGAWNELGEPVEGHELDLQAWLEVAPDEWDTTDVENPVAVRPTVFKDIHQWAGWQEKQL